MAWGDKDELVADASSGGWGPGDTPVSGAAPAVQPPATFDALAPGIGPLGVVTGGPLVHLAKPLVNRFLSKSWADYITGLQRAAFQGATMNFGDEALAGVGSLTGQGTYDDLVARERAANKGFRQENPTATMLSELYGAASGAAMVPLGPFGRTAIQGAARGAPFAARAGRFGAQILERALKGAGVGAAFGYGSGFGEGEGGAEARNEAGLAGAKTGAILGGALNAGLPVVASTAGGILDAGRGAARAILGPQTQGARQAAAGEVIEKLGQKSGKDLLMDLATGQSGAPKVADVPVPTANIMENPGLQAATRAELRRDPATAVMLREQREAGARTALDDLRPDGAPAATRAALEGEDVARRGMLDAAEAERQAAIREAQDAARAQQFAANEGAREARTDARALGQASVDEARATGAQRLEALQRSLDERMQTLREQGVSEVEAAHTAATDALMATGAFPDKTAASRAARQAIEEELAANKRIGKGLYRDVPEGTRLNVEPVYDALAAVHREAYDSGRLSLLPNRVQSTEILDLFRNATPQRLQGMKSMLYEDAANLSRAGQNTSAKWARDVARSIDDVLASGGADSGVPELRAASDWWRDKVVPYRQGAIGDILKVGADGLPRIEPSRTLGAVIKPAGKGGTEAIDQFIQAAGGRENALTAATDWAVRDAADFAIGRNGRIDLPRLNRWMRERAPVLDALPGLRDRLGNARDLAERAETISGQNTTAIQRAKDEAQAAIRQAQDIVAAEIKAAQGKGAAAVQDAATRGREMVRQVEHRAREHVREVQDTQAARVEAAKRSVDEIQKSAARLFLGTDPMKAAQGIMNSADPARAYLQVADRLRGNHEALAGLKRSIFDALESELTGFATVETGFRRGTRDMIAANTPMLRAVFGRDQADKAVELLRALEASKAHVNIPGNVGSATAEKGAQDDIYGAVLSAVVDRKMQHIPLIGPLLEMARGSARDSVRALARDALFDPEKMRVLLETRVTRESAPSIAKRLTGWMERRTMEGIPIRAMGDATDQERARRAHGGRAGFADGGTPDALAALLRSLRASDTRVGDPYGPAPSLVPSSPYPIYYLPPGYASGVSGAPSASTPTNPAAAVAGTPASAGVLSPYYDPPNGVGASTSPNVSSGPSQGVAQTSVGMGIADAVGTIASMVGPPGIGMVAQAPAVANALGLVSSIAQPGVATVDVSTNNVNADTAAQAAQAAAAANDPSVSPVGIGIGPSPNSGQGPTAGDNQQAPGDPAGGPDTSPGDPSGAASGNDLKRGGIVRRMRRDDGGRAEPDLMDRLRALAWRYGSARNMAPFAQRLGYAPASGNVEDIRALGPQEDWSQLPPTQEEIRDALWQLNGEQARARVGVAGPMYAPETDYAADLAAMINRGW